MNHPTLSKAMALAALACGWLATEIGLAQRQELTRIAPPVEEAAAPAAAAPDQTYYQPSIYRFADLEQIEYDQANAEVPAPLGSPDAPLAASEPAYGGGYGYADYCCCKLTGFVGIESTFLLPVLEDAGSSVQIEENGGPDPVYTSSEAEFDDEIMYSPRLWCGVQYCGWGVVTRFWQLDHAENVFVPETPFFPQSHVANSTLEAYTFDGEISHKWYKDGCCNSERYLSGGFRYANFEASELVEAHAIVGGDFVQGLGHTIREFSGPGVTLAYGGSHVMESAPCVQLFFNVRGSFVWADITKAAQTTAWAFDPSITPGTAVNFSTAVVETDDAAFIGEVQLGVQLEYPLQCCCGRYFLRVAGEYQYWNADNGFATAGSQAFTDGAIVTSLATADELQLDLFGFTVGTGLLY